MLHILLLLSLFSENQAPVVLEQGVKHELVFQKDRLAFQFELSLEAQEHVRVQFEQKSCLLKVQVIDPKGNVIKHIAKTNRVLGPLMLNFQAESKGRYLLIVKQAHHFMENYVKATATLLNVLNPKEYAAQLQDKRIADLREIAIPINSIQASDDDFSDMMPLKEKIGDARIVLLGEQTHRDGATISAKARMVHFLRKEMGFNVLMFETGLYEVYRFQKDFYEQKCTLWSKALWFSWANVAEFTPIIDMFENPDPRLPAMELCGMDSQLYGSYAMELSESIKDLILANGGHIHEDHDLFSEIVKNIVDFNYLAKEVARPETEKIEQFYKVLDHYMNQLKADKQDSLEIALYLQTLKTLKTQAKPHLVEGVTLKERSIIRDKQMGENVLWWANEIYPTEKIVIWSATSHNTRKIHGMRDYQTEERFDRLVMGDHIYNAIGDDMYSIAFSGYQGFYGNKGDESELDENVWLSRAINTDMVPELEIEEMFHFAGFKYGFLDFRNATKEWLKTPQVTRIAGHIPYEGSWPQIIDAMFFIHDHQLATPVKKR